MARFGERAYVKTGAEGMFCAALPEQGLGIALKCDDGSGRAAEVAMAALMASLLPLEPPDRAFIAPFMQPTLRNWRGLEVGALRPTSELVAHRTQGR
jgi:L-asparaginase II